MRRSRFRFAALGEQVLISIPLRPRDCVVQRTRLPPHVNASDSHAATRLARSLRSLAAPRGGYRASAAPRHLLWLRSRFRCAREEGAAASALALHAFGLRSALASLRSPLRSCCEAGVSSSGGGCGAAAAAAANDAARLLRQTPRPEVNAGTRRLVFPHEPADGSCVQDEPPDATARSARADLPTPRHQTALVPSTLRSPLCWA